MPFPSISTATQGYMIAKEAKGLSGFTLRNYRIDLRKFVDWLGDPLIDQVTPQRIRQYFSYLKHEFAITHVGSYQLPEPRKLSAKSIRNTWGVLSNFWKWAATEFEIDNPFDIPFIKANTRPISPVPEDEVRALLKVCDTAVRVNKSEHTTRRPTAKRDKAIILMLIDTGLRVSELCNLKVKDVDFKANRAYVTGKGDKGRYVYMGKICRQAMWRYFIERFPDAKAPLTEPFFVQGDGIHPLNRNNVRLLLGRLGEKVGDPNLHPHRFRHAFAIQFLRNGGNIFELQHLLGHSSLEMVQHYAHLAEMDLEHAAMRSSPADHWRL